MSAGFVQRSLWIAATAGLLLASGCEGSGGDDAEDTTDSGDSMGQPDAAPGGADASEDLPDAAPDEADADMTPEADAAPVAEPDAAPTAEDCTNGADDDFDGMMDCADMDCASQFVCQVPACAVGTPVFLKAADLPKFIDGGKTVTGNLPNATAGVVTDLALKVFIKHPYLADLDIQLVTPVGTIIDVSSDNGSSNDDYMGTVFRDDAASTITSGTAPFAGKFKPEQLFGTVRYQAAAGTWKVNVIEDFDDGSPATDQGAFGSAELMLCICDNCELAGACNDGMDNDNDMATDCADTDCMGDVRCMPEAICNDGKDDDLDGKTDCADSQCDMKSGCEFAVEKSCSDNSDNDADGAKDCADPDCSMAAYCLPESNCSDMIDNDMDGKRDCADPGCVAAGGMCETVEVSCSDGFDNDGDLSLDCGDPDCALECAIGACPMGSSKVVAVAAGVPATIPDVSSVMVPVVVNATGMVVRAAVVVTVTHGWAEDVDMGLVKPGAAAPGLDLASDVGGSGDNFTETIFADSAATAITAGTPPFTGPFRPEQPLSTLNGTPAAGTWNLYAADDEGAFAGTVNKFELHLCVQ